MNQTTKATKAHHWVDLAQAARRQYAEILAGRATTAWWDAVIVTSSTAAQAERYLDEIARRKEKGQIPSGPLFLVVPDIEGARIGSGGATINALRALAERTLPSAGVDSLVDWWSSRRVLVIHSGGESRRLPQYSLSGKLFTVMPVNTAWGEPSTVFDETLALSTGWVARMSGGLVVGSGDMVLTLDSGSLHWDTPGVSGVALRLPVEVGSRHGVYVLDDQGRVRSFLQKPTADQMREVGAILDDDRVAVDSGLIRFDPESAARLTGLAGVGRAGQTWQIGSGLLDKTAIGCPAIDLYDHITRSLTGEWRPTPDDAPALGRLAQALQGLSFRCDLVEGDFAHIGTTSLFRRLMTQDTDFSRLYEAQQRFGGGGSTRGVVIDSVFSGGVEMGPGAVAIECLLDVPARIARGAIVHGLSDLGLPVEVPEDTVVHQVPVKLPDGQAGIVIRVYGVEDDPKKPACEGATWLGQPILEMIESLEMEADAVWPDVPPAGRTLWNARLFPVARPDDAWKCARWMLGLSEDPPLPGGGRRGSEEFSIMQWRKAEKLSLASSADLADLAALADLRARRMQSNWVETAVAYAKGGSDIRPFLAHSPGMSTLAAAGQRLAAEAARIQPRSPTGAASHYHQAGLFLSHAGLVEEAEHNHEAAFRCVTEAVCAGTSPQDFVCQEREWACESVTASAPPRVDLGGGWSDTPPFCIDWGGAVLNIALSTGVSYPISTTVRRLEEPMIRCVSTDSGEMAEFVSAKALWQATSSPGCPFLVSLTALRMAGIVSEGRSLEESLKPWGGGLEVSTSANLPMGSGLGTSSILAATVLQALAAIRGFRLSEQALVEQVLRIEQLMTTGGGWQDQAACVFPGAKLITSGSGVRQVLRAQPVPWSAEREKEFDERFILYYTGITRIARTILSRAVASYLARETASLNMLHRSKAIAYEMHSTMAEGDWEYLGRLIDEQWQLNQVLVPGATNAHIDALLSRVRPYVLGAKLAGAGGGGFLLMLAKSRQAAHELKALLSSPNRGEGSLYDYHIAHDGMRVRQG